MSITKNTIPKLDSNLKEGDQISARQWNALAGMINGAQARGGIQLTLSPKGLIIGGVGGGSYRVSGTIKKLAFDQDTLKTTAEVWPVYLHIHGYVRGGLPFSDSDPDYYHSIELPEAENVYLYITGPRSGGVFELATSTTLPDIDGSAVLNLLLARITGTLTTFTATDGTTEQAYTYKVAMVHHKGDFNFDTPIAR